MLALHVLFSWTAAVLYAATDNVCLSKLLAVHLSSGGESASPDGRVWPGALGIMPKEFCCPALSYPAAQLAAVRFSAAQIWKGQNVFVQRME